MPTTASYKRIYYSVTYDELPTIPLREGNVIAISDTDGFYYDVGNPVGSNTNVVRRKANGIEFIASLDERREEPTTIFVVKTGTTIDESGNTIDLYCGYSWDYNAGYYQVFTNFHDAQVRSVAQNDTQAYLVGSINSATNTGTLIKNSNIYITATNKIHGNLEGNADTATDAAHATAADNSTYADYDNPDSPITPHKITSYLHDVSSNATTNLGSTITFTLGDDSQKSIRVSDTTYNVYTSSTAGLVNGTNTTVNSDSTNLLLSGSGWINKGNVSVGLAEKANKDNYGSGQVIASTYIKGISYNASTEVMTVTKGDGTTSTVSIPDTTYNVYTTGTDGLVPGPTANDAGKVLTADGYWTALPVYTSPNTSNPGLVPVAGSGKDAYYLKGDGTWGTTFTSGTDGLVPGPAAGITSDYSLRADGSWGICPDTKNTAGATDVNVTQSQSALFLVGAENQGSNPQTYSDENVYILNHKLYQLDSDAVTPTPVEVVDVSSIQALTNKTYEGYTLGNACEATVSSTVNPDATLPTGNAVTTYVGNQLQELAYKLDSTVVAPLYDTTIGYAVGDYRMYADNTGTKLYKCNTAITAPAGAFDPSKWDVKTITTLDTWLSATLTAGNTTVTISDASIVVGSIVEVYTDVYGLLPTNVAITSGQAVLTFAAQGTDLHIKMKVI